MPDVSVLDVALYGSKIGTLTLLPGDRSIFAFTQDYIEDAERPTLSLSFKDDQGALIANQEHETGEHAESIDKRDDLGGQAANRRTWPWRTDFSRLDAALMASSGMECSMSFRRVREVIGARTP